MVLAAFLLLQTPPAGPLVGDTVWVEREIAAPAGSLLRPLPWDPGEAASLLGPPEVIARPGGWLLRYPMAFWRAGDHRLVIPGPLVIQPDGTTDSLPARAAQVMIRTVLPSTRADTLAPREAADLVAAGDRSPQPVLVLLLLAAALMLPVHWWWRRRGRSAPSVPRSPSAVLTPPDVLRAWADHGELRAAADGWIAHLERGPASADADALLAALREARFDSGDRDRLARLCAEVSAR